MRPIGLRSALGCALAMRALARRRSLHISGATGVARRLRGHDGMSAATTPLPAPVAGASSATDQALEVARSLLNLGYRADALTWLKRAIEAADEAGDSARVAALARALSEVSESMAAPAPPPTQRPLPPPAPSAP